MTKQDIEQHYENTIGSFIKHFQLSGIKDVIVSILPMGHAWSNGRIGAAEFRLSTRSFKYVTNSYPYTEKDLGHVLKAFFNPLRNKGDWMMCILGSYNSCVKLVLPLQEPYSIFSNKIENEKLSLALEVISEKIKNA